MQVEWSKGDFDALRKTPLFFDFSAEQLQEVLQRGGVSTARFDGGQTIYTPTQFVNSLGVVLAGAAMVQKQGGCNTMLMSVLCAGDLFGAASLFQDANQPYVVSIRAMTPVRALLVEEPVFVGLLHEDGRLMERYLRYLTDRVRFLNRRIEGFVQPTVEERLMLLLQQYAGEGGICKLPFSLSALSDALCVSRATLYRAMDALQAAGRIRRDRRTIVLYPKEEQRT